MTLTKKELRRQMKALPRVGTILTDATPPKGSCIMVFWPLPDEVDTRPFVRQCHTEGVCIVLPVVVGDDIELRLYEGDESLRPGAFGILEPQGSVFTAYDQISRIYVPGVCFTPDGRRMGRGRGYYDRFLACIEEMGAQPELVGVCPYGHLLPDIPTESHDRRVHRVLCPLPSDASDGGERHTGASGVVSILLAAACLMAGGVVVSSCKRQAPADNPAFVQHMDTTGAADPYVYEGDSAYSEAAAIRRVQDTWKLRQERHRRVRAPYINKEKGIISTYDHLFKEASAVTGWDWRLIAAQCYQESCFDPEARSGAGARGLMQLMPATARQYGVQPSEICHPETNVGAAARYIRHLSSLFRDINSVEERIHFVLAAYNGGYNHVRDAMALCRKYGGSPQRWQDVSRYILGLQQPRYYRDPVVKYGYMIGSETAGYVVNVVQRARQYGANMASISLPPGWKAFSLSGSGGGGQSESGMQSSEEVVRRRPANRFTRHNSSVMRPEELQKSEENGQE